MVLSPFAGRTAKSSKCAIAATTHHHQPRQPACRKLQHLRRRPAKPPSLSCSHDPVNLRLQFVADGELQSLPWADIGIVHCIALHYSGWRHCVGIVAFRVARFACCLHRPVAPCPALCPLPLPIAPCPLPLAPASKKVFHGSLFVLFTCQNARYAGRRAHQ